jgi:hypothetical protein
MPAVKTRSERRAAADRERNRKREIVRSQLSGLNRDFVDVDADDFFVNDSWLGRGPKQSKGKRGPEKIFGRPDAISADAAIAEGLDEWSEAIR